LVSFISACMPSASFAPLSLHDALPILHLRPLGEAGRDDVLGHVPRHIARRPVDLRRVLPRERAAAVRARPAVGVDDDLPPGEPGDRKSTRLNSSHEWISYAVFCLKKKK